MVRCGKFKAPPPPPPPEGATACHVQGARSTVPDASSCQSPRVLGRTVASPKAVICIVPSPSPTSLPPPPSPCCPPPHSPPTYLPIYLSTYLPIYLSTYLPIYLSTHLPIYLPPSPPHPSQPLLTQKYVAFFRPPSRSSTSSKALGGRLKCCASSTESIRIARRKNQLPATSYLPPTDRRHLRIDLLLWEISVCRFPKAIQGEGGPLSLDS